MGSSFICLVHICFGEAEVFFPPNKEINFVWNANIVVGSLLPVTLSSDWNLTAKLTVLTANNVTHFQLSEVRGEGERADVQPLQTPWQALYDGSQLTGLAVPASDPAWAVNVKRALTSLLQLDAAVYATAGSKAFVAYELGIYGNCKVEYFIEPVVDGKKQVTKVLDLGSCSNFPSTFWSSSPRFLCSSSYQQEVISHSEREYELDLEGPFTLRKVSSKGSIVLQPYQAQAEANHALFRQSLTLSTVSVANEPISHSSPLNSVSLTYEDVELDSFFGQPPLNKSDVLLEIQDKLGLVSDSLWWEVGSRGLDNDTVFSLVSLMSWLDLDDWENLYQTVTLGTSYQQETMQHLFWELVPQVGSPSSALFIRDLVRSERVKGLLAGHLLVNFPFHQRRPSEQLLAQCEELLHWSAPIHASVRRSAVLSFATLIHKTCSNNCKPDTIDRYAKLYLDRFTESIDYEDRMLYMQGLSNIELPQSLDYLASVITGHGSETDRHIQFLASWAVLNTAFTDPPKVFGLFWPLLHNRSQPLEVRVAAMTLVILSRPAPHRLISLYWYMQSEPSQQLYNFYYTTIHSLASTTYPCYGKLGAIASSMARFVKRRSSAWATGNYLLDYEDRERGYGGLLQLLSVGSQRSGLPTVFIFMTEQHSLGVTTSYVLYIKAEGVGDGIKRQLHNMTVGGRNINFEKIAQLLKTLKAPIKAEEDIHLEFIFKVDGRTVITQYLNSSSFHNISTVVKRLSSVYFEFSVNYQRLSFPLSVWRGLPTDVGLPALAVIRGSSLLSARGSVSQEDQGQARDTQLDLRYSWTGQTSLQVYSPLSNKWRGATRTRSLHLRLPFAVKLQFDTYNDIYKIKTIHHKDYAAGSRLGGVWHTVSSLLPRESLNHGHDIKEEWTMDSQDLGARLGASVFDCPGKTTLSDTLHLLKKAFFTKEKNYQMVPGGVALLGMFALKEHLAFQPPSGNCGLMLSLTPLLSQVEPELTWERGQLRLQMVRRDGVLWEIQAGLRKRLDSHRELTFKLYHTPGLRAASAGDAWRVIQLEGALLLPSAKAPPTPLSGYAIMSWGDSSPTQVDKAAILDMKVMGVNDSGPTCDKPSPSCLHAQQLHTRQLATLQYVNLPSWLVTAAHALFPEHIQTESSSTEIAFNAPAWTSKGVCVVDGDILTLDGSTASLAQSACFTLLVADCSKEPSFAVLLKKMENPQHLAVTVYVDSEIIELLPSTNGSIEAFINESTKLDLTNLPYEHGATNQTSPIFSLSTQLEGAMDVELSNGVVVQHYTGSVVVLVPTMYKGHTCGLCGDYSGDTAYEPINQYTLC